MDLIPEDRARQLKAEYGNKAANVADLVLSTHSMYMGGLNPKWKYWNDVKQSLNL